jgi:class 3 adenylate cyclase
MQCNACGEVNPAADYHCPRCGGVLSRVCSACGLTCDPRARFCGACGAPLVRVVDSADAALVSASRRLYSPHEQLLHSPHEELKPVTVLFVDLVSSTEIVALLDAEAAMARLEPVLQTMCGAVARFGGTVLQTLGDGIMAVFGAPHAQEGHAVLACQAALAIRESFRVGAGVLSVRTGLHSGEVVFGTPLTGPANKFGAYGIALHLGSRLPPLVDPGEICISGACCDLVRPFCEVKPLGRRVLRGVPQSVEVYVLIGMKPAVASQQFRAWFIFGHFGVTNGRAEVAGR